jgi:CheY-like chemotaxis protein
MPGDLPSDKPEARARLVVLIAEDEEPIADALAMIVEEAGYTPLVAPHGAEALQLARTQHPALLITDLMMPYLDGEKLIQAVEEDARQDGRARIPIILTTAAGERRLEHVEADVLLKKPFDVEDVEDLLRRFLDKG